MLGLHIVVFGVVLLNMEQTIVALPGFYINPRNSSERPQKKFAKNPLKKTIFGSNFPV
jgi:hypothetical protein